MTNVFHLQQLQEQISQTVARLRPALTEKEFAEVAGEAGRLKERIQQRQFDLQRQLSEPEPALLVFTNGVCSLTGWGKVDAPAPGLMDQGETSRPSCGVAYCGPGRERSLLANVGFVKPRALPF